MKYMLKSRQVPDCYVSGISPDGKVCLSPAQADAVKWDDRDHARAVAPIWRARIVRLRPRNEPSALVEEGSAPRARTTR